MTGDRTYDLTSADLTRQLADLGDDEPAERFDYDLCAALVGWAEVTRGTDRDAAGQLRWATSKGSSSHTLSASQADRLTHLLNLDTAVVLAHRAAAREE
ncbi:hypothetical protein [Streptacidiphilus cavernicola]|uniref:HNH endonuclease n=1 Tax=Streptacidiphilus cavernicola TaxID=3342716 RepID=A0ABV6VXR9_9ACTN